MHPLRIYITPQCTCLSGGSELLSMSWIHIFTAILFISMSLSSVGKPELLTLPSAHQHGRFSSSQLAQLSRKRVCTPRPGCNHCPDTHHISSWPPPCDPCQTHADFVSSKETAAGMCKRILELEAGAWGRAMANQYLSWKASEGIPVWARDTILFNFASSFIGLFMCNSSVVLLPSCGIKVPCGYLLRRAPWLCSIAAALQ